MGGKTILSLTNTICRYCELPFSDIDFIPSRDHFIPLSKGGKKGASNVYIVCKLCNHMKGNFMPYEFIYWLDCKIRWGEPVIVSGIEYHIDTLTVIKKNVKDIYNNKPPTTGTVIITTKKAKGNKILRGAEDVSLSVNTNTSRRQSEEQVAFLQSQTVEQFRYKKHLDELVKWQLSLPEPNFHYE